MVAVAIGSWIHYNNTGERKLLAEAEYTIEEMCGTITECRMVDGGMRCWVMGHEVFYIMDFEDRPTWDDDWICYKIRELNT